MTGSRKVRVLVFPCGAENATEVHEALRYSVHVELYGASSVDDHGRFRFERYQGDLPRIDNPDFDASFAALVSRWNIDLVFPAHDTVAEYLAPRAASMGFHLVNGDIDTARLTRRKSSTYELFRKMDWCPAVFSGPDEVRNWPVIVKPDQGQGAQGVVKARNLSDLLAALAITPEPLIVEYLPGAEVSVDCFTDRHGQLLWSGARTRERVRAGISMRSAFLAPDPIIREIAEEINRTLRLRGPWFFQLKQAGNGAWKLLEISCRMAGTMAAQRARGVNLPLMAVQDFLGRDLTVLPEGRVHLIDRSIATRAQLDYEFDTVFVDLDDTLIIDGHVTPVVIHFLFQMRGMGRRIILITRHEFDCVDTLDRACLSLKLFDEIIHITDGSPKEAHITPRSIFIDNHFPERHAVSKKLGVPVLDVDALEFLIR